MLLLQTSRAIATSNQGSSVLHNLYDHNWSWQWLIYQKHQGELQFSLEKKNTTNVDSATSVDKMVSPCLANQPVATRMLVTALINSGVHYSVALIMVTLTNVLAKSYGWRVGGLYRAHWTVTNKSSDRYQGTGQDRGGCKSALLQGNSFSHLRVDSRLLNLPLRYWPTPILHISVHEAHHHAQSLPERKSAVCGIS